MSKLYKLSIKDLRTNKVEDLYFESKSLYREELRRYNTILSNIYEVVFVDDIF